MSPCQTLLKFCFRSIMDRPPQTAIIIETLVWLFQMTFLGADIAIIFCPWPTKRLVWLDVLSRQVLLLLNASFIYRSFHNMPEILYHLREFRDELLNTFGMTTPLHDYKSCLHSLHFYHWCTTLSYVIWCVSLKISNIHRNVLTLKTTSLSPTAAL